MRSDRKSRAHRYRHGGDAKRDQFDVWAEHVQTEEDPDRKEAIIEAGRAHGWVDAHGRVLDPHLTPRECQPRLDQRPSCRSS